MLANDADWARGYAKQALSDPNAREILVSSGTDKCHRLHFLQMAAEKACKAFLTAKNGHEHLRKTHAYVARVLPILARQFYAVENAGNPITDWELSQIRSLAREIEVLAQHATTETFVRTIRSIRGSTVRAKLESRANTRSPALTITAGSLSV